MERLKGTPVSPGYAVGEVVELDRRYAGLNRIVLPPQREAELFYEARAAAQEELGVLASSAHPAEKDIFTFQQMVLEDEGFEEEVKRYIRAGAGAAASVERASRIFEQRMRELGDDYLSQRAVDIRDTCRRLIDILDGRTGHRFAMEKKGVLAAEELYPSDLVSLEKEHILAFITGGGSPESHVSIMARTLRLPAVVELGPGFARKAAGKTVAVNGETGEVFLDPDGATLALFEEKICGARVCAGV
ncbi:MAG: phosphoenolpyruvate-utilizing N-terminal domain-containing protein [Oscillospiraceae bacterium]|nr:phosphoenolpyruvate-utilizing N-terminal domain-containing protein [Oscillospiraceae bacterium]